MRIVREQRVAPDPDVTFTLWEDEDGRDVVDADDYRDLRCEILRLQAAVMGEPSPGP